MGVYIEIEKTSGFCAGVVSAIKKAEKVLQEKEIYCLGQIVHNEEELKRLEQKGLKTINYEEFCKLTNVDVLFRAHGEPPKSYEIARKNNITIIDATCKIVADLQKKVANAFLNGENIFIFGKKEHPEIIGLLGQTNNTAIVFESLEKLRETELPSEITLFSQTTMSIDEYEEVINFLIGKGIKLKVHNSICKFVSSRKEELCKFCKKFDLILFVGGKKSSNGKFLYGVCKKANDNSFYISNIDEIKKEWLLNVQSIGICGATSTPKWQLELVKDYIESLINEK